MSIETIGEGLTAEGVARVRQAIADRNVAEAEARKTCVHADHDFPKHGRCCPTCGTVMTDFGD